jgi:hypothetical protein
MYKLNTEELKELVKESVESRIPLMIWGRTGIGKSQVIKDYCKDNNYQLIDIRLSQLVSEDLGGIPVYDKPELIRKFSKFLPTSNEKGVLFLDEINQADTDVLNSAFQLILDKKLGGGEYVLPESWSIIAAGNTSEDGDVNTFNKALYNRFIHCELEFDKKSFIDYIRKENYDENLVNFLEEQNKVYIDDERILITPRSWQRVNDCIKNNRPHIINTILIGRINKLWLEWNENLKNFKDIYEYDKPEFFDGRKSISKEFWNLKKSQIVSIVTKHFKTLSDWVDWKKDNIKGVDRELISQIDTILESKLC